MNAGRGLVVRRRTIWSPEPDNVELTRVSRAMGSTQGSSTNGAAFGDTRGEDAGTSTAPLWDQKTGSAASGFCNLKRMMWLHSCARWLPMDFLDSEAQRDQDLHGRVVPMDAEDFCAHSVGFYKRADQWCGRHSKSQPIHLSRKMATCSNMSLQQILIAAI